MQNMDATEIVKELTKLKDELEYVLNAYRERGENFGNQRNESWRRKVGSFLKEHLPNEDRNFNRTFSIARAFGSGGERPDVFFWNTEGDSVVAYIDSLIIRSLVRYL
jgi:hypothetical protein